MTADVEVRDPTPVSAALREPRGAEVAVRVVDDADRPLPFPSVRLRGPFGRRGDHGAPVLRLDPHGDAFGRRAFLRCALGATTVSASYGPLRGEAVVDARDGERVEAKVVVRAPPSAPRGDR
jgi:hypothetical protein